MFNLVEVESMCYERLHITTLYEYRCKKFLYDETCEHNIIDFTVFNYLMRLN